MFVFFFLLIHVFNFVQVTFAVHLYIDASSKAAAGTLVFVGIGWKLEAIKLAEEFLWLFNQPPPNVPPQK